MRSMASLLLTLLALMRVVPGSDGCAAITALELMAGMGGDGTHNQNHIILLSTHMRIHCTRGTRGARITDQRSVVRTLRWRLPCSGIHLTSAATAQQQQHSSGHCIPHAMRQTRVHGTACR